ncbi:MAG: glycosyltransferase [Candidatus Latescibacteria bacterium]|nr:glycosyltransferase [Candidatus Latescibacterota bacterium]
MKNETIICIAPRDWHGLWKEAQSIMSRIALDNRVLYFDPGRDSQASLVGEMIGNLPNFFSLRTEQVQKNLTVISSPSVLPYARSHLPRSLLQVMVPGVARINAEVLIRHVHRAMQSLEVVSPILWLYGPYHSSLVGKFGEKLACYMNYDEFANYLTNSRVKELVRRYDDQLTNLVDVVFATSRAQCKVREAINPHTYFIPNAVDFDLFNRAMMPDLPVPDDIAGLRHPIIGYAGRMARQIDIELLHRVAVTYPDCSLVLIGPDELPSCPDEQALRAAPNVFFLGWKKPSELPNYLRVFDAALIPYRLEGHVLSGYPTKLHEYLAAGRSVVATAMPELLPYSHVLHIAENNDDFVVKVGEAMRDNALQSIEARVAVARENTWDRRVEDIYRNLEPFLSGAITRRIPDAQNLAGSG